MVRGSRLIAMKGHMHRLTVVPLILCGLLLPSLASASTRTVTLKSTASSIAPGGVPTIMAGDLSGSLKGALIVRSPTVTGTGVGNLKAKVTFTAYTEAGAIKGKGELILTAMTPEDPAVPLSGSNAFGGTVTITSGTGKYRHASGTLTVTTNSPAGEFFTKITAKGKLTLP
jgi:hypothetical protein